jgi:putative peptidoglycan lipid II flippase
MLFLGQPIAHLIFAGSSSADAGQIGMILSGFALGLIPFCSSYVMLRGFYAFEDTKTPAAITLLMNIVTIVCASISYLVLPIRLITVGIAVSFGIGYLSSSLLARHLLSKRIGIMTLKRELISIIGISAVALAPCLFVYGFLENLLNAGEPNLITSLLALIVSGVIALPIYAGLGYRLKVSSIIFAVDSIKKRLIKR